MDVRRAITVPSNVKSIQRGVIAIPFNGTSATATISAVNTAKSELRFLGFTSAEPSTSNTNAFDCNIVLTNSTTITATKLGTGNSNISVSYEITEFN